MSTASHIEIDLARLDHNVRAIRGLIGPQVALCAVVKADAYGLGAARIARRLQDARVDLLAVYTLEQAEELVRANVSAPLLILMPVREIERTGLLYRSLVSGRLHFVVHDEGHLTHLIRLAERFGCAVPIHVEVDTGMSRGGVNARDLPRLLERVAMSKAVRLVGLFTHFASADCDDAATREQFDDFTSLTKRLREFIPPTCRLHAAATHSMLRDQSYHLNMVRVGIGLAGYGGADSGLRLAACGVPVFPDPRPPTPDPRPHPPSALPHPLTLQPILTWKTALVHVKWIEPGTTVGYGRTWAATRRTRLGLLPVGYADGYSVGLSNHGIVRLLTTAGAVEAPVVGRVSMDQATIDLTDIPEGLTPVGTPVELIGLDPSAPTHLPRLAEIAGTHAYALLCGLSPRLPRIYRQEIAVPVAAESSQPAPERRTIAHG